MAETIHPAVEIKKLMERLREQHGSHKAAAGALGIPERTYADWRLKAGKFYGTGRCAVIIGYLRAKVVNPEEPDQAANG